MFSPGLLSPWGPSFPPMPHPSHGPVSVLSTSEVFSCPIFSCPSFNWATAQPSIQVFSPQFYSVVFLFIFLLLQSVLCSPHKPSPCCLCTAHPCSLLNTPYPAVCLDAICPPGPTSHDGFSRSRQIPFLRFLSLCFVVMWVRILPQALLASTMLVVNTS